MRGSVEAQKLAASGGELPEAASRRGWSPSRPNPGEPDPGIGNSV